MILIVCGYSRRQATGTLSLTTVCGGDGCAGCYARGLTASTNGVCPFICAAIIGGKSGRIAQMMFAYKAVNNNDTLYIEAIYLEALRYE